MNATRFFWPLTAILVLAACGGGASPAPAPNGLNYVSPQAYTVNAAITPLSPTVSGTVSSYSVAPTLPAGLSLNTTTGQITGTPTAATALIVYTITAINASGSTTFALSIGVNPAAPTALSYPSPQSLTVGTAIAALNPTVTGSVSSYSVAPALPTGLSLATATGQIAGLPAAPVAAANYTITATNAGGSTTFALNIAVSTARVTVDRTDEKPGYQVHMMYLLPFDGIDRAFDTNGTIAGSITSAMTWLATQTGGKKFRIDTYSNGQPDITFLRTRRTNAQLVAAGNFVRDRLEAEMFVRDFNATNKLYLLFYEGGSTVTCGQAPVPPSLHGNVVAIYLQGTPPNSAACNTNPIATATQPPGYIEFIGLHEVMHALGAVPTCARNYTAIGHTSDSPMDLMYAGNLPWAPSVLDVGRDDYYGTGSTTCLDVANSAFFEALPSNPTPPPGWPYDNLADLGCANLNTTVPGPYGANTSVFVAADFPLGIEPNVDLYEWRQQVGAPAGTYVRNLLGTLTSTQNHTTVTVQAGAVLTTSEGASCKIVARATASPGRMKAR